MAAAGFAVVWLWAGSCAAQTKLQLLPLPQAISSVNEEFSGLAQYHNRVYFLPQMGHLKQAHLNDTYNIYSITTDSINRAINHKDSLHFYRTISVKNLAQLPAKIVNNYQGFEAMCIVGGQVYFAIEADDSHNYCYLIKGLLDTIKNEINIDNSHYITLPRYFHIKNSGFESLTYLPKQKKLVAFHEFNAMPGGSMGYLIDPAFKKSPKAIKTPFLYLRLTDMTAAKNGRLYGINYYWNGDYNNYLNNGIVKHLEAKLKAAIPDLEKPINNNPDYLKDKQTTYARIISLKSYKDKKWQQVVAFDGEKNNWEGITLFKKGALIITDANHSNKQLTTFGYVEF